MLIYRIRALKWWKSRPVVCFTAGLFLLCSFWAAQILRPLREYHLEGQYRFETGSSTQNTVLYEGISLPPGTYRIRLEYQTDTDLSAVCKVKDGTVYFGGLLSNGEHLYRNLDCTGYTMWLLEGTDGLQVTMDYGGKGALRTGSLTIRETRELWTMLLTVTLFLGLAVYAAVIWRCYDREYGIPREKKQVVFWLAVISMAASVPYLCGYTITGADLTYHLQRIEGVKDGLLGGQFPVRLEPRWAFDHGYANAIFYCNSLLYLPAILRLLGFTVNASYNVYCVTLNIATAWIAYYCFAGIFKKPRIGLICSALYTLSINRTYKLIVTSAVGEGSAMTFLPLILYGLYRIFTEAPEEKDDRGAWMPLMFGFAGLMQTHVLTCEITAFVTLLFCLAFIRRVFRRRTFLALVRGAVSAVLISLWFLVPFLDYYLTQDVHIKHVSARTIQDRGLYWAQLAFHFWTTGINAPSGEGGMQYSHPVGIGLVLIMGLALFLILWFSGAFRQSVWKGMTFAKVTALSGVLLLCMSLNTFPWDRIQSLYPAAAALVSSLQFPNRFLGWGTVCLVMIFGCCLWYLEEKNVQWYRMALLLAFLGLTTSDLYLLDFVNSDQDYFELYNEEGMGFGYLSGAEYLLQGTDERRLTFEKPVPGEHVELYDYEKNGLRAELRCANRSEEESFVDLPLLLYKGYRAVDLDTGQRLPVLFGDNNKVRVQLPAGFEGAVQVRFVSPLYWRISEGISAITVLIMLVYICGKGKKEQNGKA